MKWYKFWVTGSVFEAIYGQAEDVTATPFIKVFNAFTLQATPEGMGLIPLTKNKQGDGMPFPTEENYLYLQPVMYAPVDENEEQFRDITSKLTSGISVATRMPSESRPGPKPRLII
jgi:hypothetical protein